MSEIKQKHKERSTTIKMAEAAAGENEEYIVIDSPYGDNIEMFDNEETLPDLLFVFGEEDDISTLWLHRGVVARGSRLAQGTLRSKEQAETPDMNQMGWTFGIKKEVERETLVKALRFCYGEPMRVGTHDGECCAMIATLSRLQITCLDEVLEKLTAFAIDEAKKDARVGAELLVATQDYSECCTASVCELDKALAKVVFTSKNLYENYEEVVDNCLMKLPAEYLEMVDFGEPHQRCSEFNIRLQYVNHHGESMSADEKREEMNKCDWTMLNRDELRELNGLKIVEPEAMVELLDKVLERTEREKREYEEQAEITENEKNDATRKSKIISSHT